MSHEVLNPRQFFHGTRWPLKKGSMLTPEGGRGRASSGYGQTDLHVYFTTSHGAASQFAEGGYGPPGKPDAPPHVYRVEPTGPHKPDPDEPDIESFKTQHPVRVLGRMS